MKTTKKTTAVATVADEQSLALLRSEFPMEQGFQRVLLPRLGMVSQDVVEGKGKSMKVVTEAGMFFIEKQTDEEDGNGKKIWKRQELGDTIEGIIVYKRYQLRAYDEKTEMFTSSPIYDSNDQILPLFCNKTEVARGTPAELKALPQFAFEKDGKKKSKLEENRLLYVLYNDEIYQLTLRGTSMYSFMAYARKTLPPSVVTKFGSEAQEKGTIAWNQMTFEEVRDLNADEVADVVARIKDIKEGIASEKAYYDSVSANKAKADKDLEDFG